MADAILFLAIMTDNASTETAKATLVDLSAGASVADQLNAQAMRQNLFTDVVASSALMILSATQTIAQITASAPTQG